ncbi:ADM_collapsed_G0016580.mRNA.1.CDS.1 [Saccharomyces cerevisiae]|nr:ADM_collapsed_G0016580.mRNA.1.CDS.1 [Saccharomyces cerevisiae]
MTFPAKETTPLWPSLFSLGMVNLFQCSLSVEMVFVLLLLSTRIHEVVVLICYKLQHATWSWGNMSKNFSLKPDISLSFLLDIIFYK